MNERRRDRQGRFVKVCIHLNGCATKAQYAVEGFGDWGIAQAIRPAYCLRHGRSHTNRMNRGRYYRDGYRLVKVEGR